MLKLGLGVSKLEEKETTTESGTKTVYTLALEDASGDIKVKIARPVAFAALGVGDTLELTLKNPQSTIDGK